MRSRISGGRDRLHRGVHDLHELEPLVPALVFASLAVVPVDLVLKPVPRWVRGYADGTTSIGRREPAVSPGCAICTPYVGADRSTPTAADAESGRVPQSASSRMAESIPYPLTSAAKQYLRQPKSEGVA
jgi:hypothetical protein